MERCEWSVEGCVEVWRAEEARTRGGGYTPSQSLPVTPPKTLPPPPPDYPQPHRPAPLSRYALIHQEMADGYTRYMTNMETLQVSEG